MALLVNSVRYTKIYLRNYTKNILRMSGAPFSSSPQLADKVLQELQSNPFYDKYSAKISVLQQLEPEQLKSRIEKIEEKKKPKAKKMEAKERTYSSAPEQGKPQLESSPFTKPKILDDLMKTELLVDKTSDEIKQLWLDYHRQKDVIVGVIPQETYTKMYEKGVEFSTFVLPVPRSQGYEYIMCQTVGHEVHLTPLIAYQTHKENAPECLTITYYTDLQDKGIVLMKGEYDTDILNCQEAQCLANQLQLYYAQDNEKRLKLLQRFTYKPNEFNHMDLIAELECLSL